MRQYAPIIFWINNIGIYYENSEELYEFSDKEITEDHLGIKRLNVNMVWQNENEQTEKVLNIKDGTIEEDVLILKAAEYDDNGEFVSLNEGGTGSFYLIGTMNSNPNLVWEMAR